MKLATKNFIIILLQAYYPLIDLSPYGRFLAIFRPRTKTVKQTFQTNQLQKLDSRDKSARDKCELFCLVTSLFVEVITVFIYLQHLLQ